MTQLSFKWRAKRVWNSLSDDLRDCKSLPVLKRRLKKWLITNRTIAPDDPAGPDNIDAPATDDTGAPADTPAPALPPHAPAPAPTPALLLLQ